jgi:quercetin dioxygenase-like cupin family protein
MLQAIEQELTTQGYSLHAWSNGPNFKYPVHDHPYHKIIVVLKGSIAFSLPGENREVAMNVGDRLELPPRTAHSAVVGSSGVTCLEGQKSA